MTLKELRDLLIAYAGRTDPEFLGHATDFVKLGHRWVERQWSGREQFFVVWRQPVTVPAGSGGVFLPPEYRESQQLTVHAADPTGPPDDMGTPLERVPMEAMVQAGPWRLSDGTLINLYDRLARGRPRAYAIYLNRMAAFRPISAMPLTLWVAGSAWSALVNDEDQTYVALEAPQAVLYAALREAWAFLGDPVQKATWEAEAQRAVDFWVRDSMQQEVAAGGLPLVMQTPG
jgi:hypothetical protein